MTNNNYESNVFINCPFDNLYIELRNALVFTIFDCGFIPRCALEEDDGGNVRVNKIMQIILESKFGIHDLSCTELDPVNSLPRFNMPLELGVFLGAKFFGSKIHKQKKCLIFEKKKFEYQKYISDISGQDIQSHKSQPKELILHVRNWLDNANKNGPMIPGGKTIFERFKLFESDLPRLCELTSIEVEELTYNNYNEFIEFWLKENPW